MVNLLCFIIFWFLNLCFIFLDRICRQFQSALEWCNFLFHFESQCRGHSEQTSSWIFLTASCLIQEKNQFIENCEFISSIHHSLLLVLKTFVNIIYPFGCQRKDFEFLPISDYRFIISLYSKRLMLHHCAKSPFFMVTFHGYYPSSISTFKSILSQNW